MLRALTNTNSGTGASSVGGTGAVRVVCIGDSITAGSYIIGDRNLTLQGFSWPSLFEYYTQGRFQLALNAGVAGDQTAQMVTRFSADVLAKKPDICVILAGTNDVSNNVLLDASYANMNSMVQTCLNARILPVIVNIPPRRRSVLDAAPPTAGVLGTIYNTWAWNLWLHLYAQKWHLPFIDIFSKLYDPATADWKATFSTDGVHPDTPAVKIIAQAVADVLIGTVSGSRIHLAAGAMNKGLTTGFPNFINMAQNGLMLVHSGGIATDMHQSATPSLTKTIVTDANILGNWQQFQVNASSSGYAMYQNLFGARINNTTVTVSVSATNLNEVVKNTAWSSTVHIGSILRISTASPAGIIPGDYIITAVSTTTATLNRNCATVLGTTGMIGNWGYGGGAPAPGDRMYMSGLYQSEAFEGIGTFNIAAEAGAGGSLAMRKASAMVFDYNPVGGCAYAGDFTYPATGGISQLVTSLITSSNVLTILRQAQIGMFNLTGLYGNNNFI